MSKNTTCPICLGNYYETEFSAEVCNHHQDWIVTQCHVCGRTCFSDCRSYCTNCAGLDDCGRMGSAQHGYNKDHRAALRSYGLE